MMVNCCWNSDQNVALAMNIGMNDTTRERSASVIFFDDRMTANSATVATSVTMTTIPARRSACSQPMSPAMTMAATPTPANSR